MPKSPITCADHMRFPATPRIGQCRYGFSGMVDQALLERAGDARRAADQLDAAVGALVVGAETTAAEQLIAHGVDKVWWRPHWASGLRWPRRQPSCSNTRCVVLASGDGAGREWAALLAVQLGWPLVSPALMAGAAARPGAHRPGP